MWGKRNFGDCKRIFERAVVEALVVVVVAYLLRINFLNVIIINLIVVVEIFFL